jgi:branched-chain amino acid aminotransferase
MDITITKQNENSRKTKPGDDHQLGFGRYFSDHFFNMTYTEGRGWHDARIEPYRLLQLDPAAMVFHYAQEIFEGLKAYRGKDGGIYLFRSRDNWRRMNRSAKRLCMPEIDVDFVNDALKKLVVLEQDWIPRKRGTALYIRPTMIATEACVGVKVSSEYLFYIIVGPVGDYYPEGFSPIKIFVSDHYIRAARGGLGEAKTGANYAASLFPAMEAKKQGYGQVLWLDAKELKYIEEVGTMNIFFRFEDEVATSPLDGTILPGITRDSVLRLCRDWGLQASERKISIDEVVDGARDGRLQEVFGSGTAAIISPVGELNYKGQGFVVGQGKVGELSQRLYQELLGIQFGDIKDPYEWIERVV